MRIENHPILDFNRGKRVTFTYNGKPISAYEGESIAAALHAAGVKVLGYSQNLRRPRGFYCAIGNCSSCMMGCGRCPQCQDVRYRGQGRHEG